MEAPASASKPNTSPVLSASVQRTCPVSTGFAILVGVAACVVICGWFLHNRTIVQISPGLAPMQATTAIGFLLFSGALFFGSAVISWNKWGLQRWFAWALLAWGAINVFQHLTHINLGIDTLIAEPFMADRSPAPGRMSMLTSLCFVMAGVAMTLSNARVQKPAFEVLIVTLAGFLSGASGAVLFAYAVGIPPVVWLGERFSEMAIHTAIAFFLLGSGIIMQRFRCGRAADVMAFRWMWIPAFTSIFFAILSIYLGLATNAEQGRRDLAALEAHAIGDVLTTRYYELKQALSRMAERVAGLNRDQESLWKADARHYLEDFESLVYLRVVDPSTGINWQYPQSKTADYTAWFRETPSSFTEEESIEFSLGPNSMQRKQFLLNVYEAGEGSDTADVLLYAVVDWTKLTDIDIDAHGDLLPKEHHVITLEPLGTSHSLLVENYSRYAVINPEWHWLITVDPHSLPLNTRVQNYFLVGGTLFAAIVAFLIHSIQVGRERLQLVEEVKWAQALEKSRLEAFVNHAPAAVAMFDHQMRYIAVSQYWLKDYALEETPVIGRSHYEIFPNVSDDWKAIHQRCMLGHVETNDRDCWRPAGWDHDQYLRWEVRPWREPDGTIGGIMMFTADITADVERELEIIQMRQDADEANRLKSQFLANMSHEIRTPMNGVVGMTSLLQESPLTKEQKDCISVIRESSDALLTLIDDILDFSKIESGRIELESEQFSLTELIATTVELLAPIALRKNNEILAWVELDGTVQILGDSGRLRQILTNLLGNATKFTENGEVTLHVTPVGTSNGKVSLMFEVKDTGIGMTEEQCSKIFQPFVQADGSTARKYGGTGLGLSISHRLVAAMGGELRVTSQLGKGAVFSFTLAFDLPESNEPVVAVPSVVDAMKGKRCLLAFYSANTARLVETRMKQWGFDTQVVLSVESAREAIFNSRMGKSPIDLVLLDSSLDENHPMQLTKELRITELPSEQKPKVLLLKSVGMSMTQKQAASVGIDHFIRKPLTPSRIYDSLSDVYQQHLADRTSDDVDTEVKPKAARFSGGKILVAEDNAVNRKVITMLFKSMGLQVDTVADGQQAIEAWEQIGYSIIIMDCQMPGMDGFTASRMIRELYRTRTERGEHLERPFIIALTANAQKGDREKCLIAGMDDYIAKPARKEALYEVLERWEMTRSSSSTS